MHGDTFMFSRDLWFKDELKRMDPKLGCFFSERSNRVLVTYDRAVGPPVVIYTVENKDRTFRVPDRSDLDTIMSGEKCDKNLAKAAKYMDDYRRDHDRKLEEVIWDRTKDDKYQLSRAFSGNTKAKHVRPITPKAKGETF